jgi:hypothetical protein
MRIELRFLGIKPHRTTATDAAVTIKNKNGAPLRAIDDPKIVLAALTRSRDCDCDGRHTLNA